MTGSSTTRLLTPKEVIEILQISQATFYRIIEKRLIPFYKIGRGLRFDYADIEKYLVGVHIESVSKWK